MKFGDNELQDVDNDLCEHSYLLLGEGLTVS